MLGSHLDPPRPAPARIFSPARSSPPRRSSLMPHSPVLWVAAGAAVAARRVDQHLDGAVSRLRRRPAAAARNGRPVTRCRASSSASVRSSPACCRGCSRVPASSNTSTARPGRRCRTRCATAFYFGASCCSLAMRLDGAAHARISAGNVARVRRRAIRRCKAPRVDAQSARTLAQGLIWLARRCRGGDGDRMARTRQAALHPLRGCSRPMAADPAAARACCARRACSW